MIPVNFYLFLKTIHILAVISWMAGLLYLPRLFVYHADTVLESVQDHTFRTMERRLMNAIMIPALVVVLITGVIIGIQGGFLHDPWFLLKGICVFLLVCGHLRFYQHMKFFAVGENKHSARYFRVINELPTVLMIFIVGLVVFKP
jgi:protoporphyrinogen IX oxidase